jgi:lysophospholipase L1-like esterase
MKVVLIGDSIRMGYQPFVARKCQTTDIWGPTINCRHSVWTLDHFQAWVADQKPDVVHFNFGIHDASPMADGISQVLLEQYRLSLERFIARVRQLGHTKMIWATTTPLYLPKEGIPMPEWSLREEYSIDAYNAAALEIVEREGLAVNDLYDVILRNDFSKCLVEDGCHMTEFGNEVLSDAVVKAIGLLL